ncbi:MAG: RnfABCDGE type electron transport complex subunit B [Eubacteriaceae bacterium]
MTELLYPVYLLGIMGLLFGGGLAYASKVFAVEVDPKVPLIKDALPGANCGGCGYPGCDAFASAVAAGDAKINGCPVGGAETSEKLGEIMGISSDSSERMIARVICKGTEENCANKFDYYGVKDCKEAMIAMGGNKGCSYGCLGLGTCEKICPFDAIHVVDGNVAVVDEDKCTGCGKCIEACPKLVIKLVPSSKKVHVDCNSKDKGKAVKVNCSTGCIGCKICVKNCPFDAITVEDNIAKIDYSKCRECMICVEKCPTNAISGDINNRKKAYIIEENCVGCTLCSKNCVVDAIEGEVKKVHKIIEEKCIGCGVCYEKCRKDAIEMR